jgi:predicted transcriptional regulator
MKILTVKIPQAIEKKFREKAKAANQSASEIVRHALAREIDADAEAEAEAVDFAKLAAPYIGMFSGPADLSDCGGYGSRKSR